MIQPGRDYALLYKIKSIAVWQLILTDGFGNCRKTVSFGLFVYMFNFYVKLQTLTRTPVWQSNIASLAIATKFPIYNYWLQYCNFIEKAQFAMLVLDSIPYSSFVLSCVCTFSTSILQKLEHFNTFVGVNQDS